MTILRDSLEWPWIRKSKLHILLEGPPASAKTMFLTSLMRRLKNSYFADGGSSSKAGMMDYLFTNKPRYLVVDEIDKMAHKDQVFLLNLMETGIVSETKYGKTRICSNDNICVCN